MIFSFRRPIRCGALPLTLTLSRQEREQPLDGQLKFASHRAEVSRYFSETLEPMLPLPGGEGRGEGERDTFNNCPAWKMFAAFPLTLTLSPEEREPPLSTSLKSVSCRADSSRGFAKTPGAFLPLPAGEGRGEGERLSLTKRLRNKSNRSKTFYLVAALLALISIRAGAENIPPADTKQLLERTCFQTGKPWSPRANLRSDVAIVYGIDTNLPARIASWRDRGYRIHVMTGVAWGEYQDYLYGRFDGINHEDEA